MIINSASVEDVNASEFDELMEQNAKLIRDLNNSKKLMKETTSKLKRELKDHVEKARKEMEDMKRESKEREHKLRLDMEKERRSAEEREKKLLMELENTKLAVKKMQDEMQSEINQMNRDSANNESNWHRVVERIQRQADEKIAQNTAEIETKMLRMKADLKNAREEA